jgi:hypothetical protein
MIAEACIAVGGLKTAELVFKARKSNLGIEARIESAW